MVIPVIFRVTFEPTVVFFTTKVTSTKPQRSAWACGPLTRFQTLFFTADVAAAARAATFVSGRARTARIETAFPRRCMEVSFRSEGEAFGMDVAAPDAGRAQ